MPPLKLKASRDTSALRFGKRHKRGE